MKSILLLVFSVSLTFFFLPTVYGEGGGGVDCPTSSGVYNYVNGTAVYETSSLGEDEVGVLFCDFESTEEDTVDEGMISAMFHISEEISQELTNEYGCGEKIGSEMGPLYVASTTHFAVVSFSTSGLQGIAQDILTQIEQQNLATTCTTDFI